MQVVSRTLRRSGVYGNRGSVVQNPVHSTGLNLRDVCRDETVRGRILQALTMEYNSTMRETYTVSGVLNALNAHNFGNYSRRRVQEGLRVLAEAGIITRIPATRISPLGYKLPVMRS